ncbi:MAG: tetratricopeptide repeat protein, partial [Candidatus Margulisbacteria bacterium]|nr:tetratricopeptide repeat protein [Candidatus Margulisiibacteriota bacterium]
MHRKILLVLALTVGLALAMGDKPVTTDAVPRGMEPLESLSADRLYRRAYAEYGAALDMVYAEQNRKAIEALSLFLEKYPDDPRCLDAQYFLLVVYGRNNQPREQVEIADVYFAGEPTDNALTDSFKLESLSAYIGTQNLATANLLYNELLEKYPTNNSVLALAHQQYLSALRSARDLAGQKKVFNFFRADNNRQYLKNPNNYYIFTYELAVIYFNEGDYQAAKPLFAEVAAQKENRVL